MPVLITYLLKLSVSLSVVYLFYQLVLRRQTFYNWSRFYLVVYSLLSFLVPYINISPVLERNEFNQNKIILLVPSFNDAINPSDLSVDNSLTIWDWTGLIIVIGIIVLLIRLCMQLLSFRKMINKAVLVSNENLKLYQVNQAVIPFSFGQSIFFNPNLHSEEELKDIILHEMVHIRQRHTTDLILSELLCILNWYNPFAWLIRYAIRQNLEFIADNKVLQAGIDKKQYQYLLLKVIGNNHFSIASQFNFSSLKKRIAMMNKMKSAKLHLLKFLFILPVIIVMLVAFRSETITKSRIKKNHAPTVVIDTVPKNNKFIITGDKADSALWIVDGKEITIEERPEIAPSLIESISVWKGDSAIKKYKEKGKNGVIEIKTKTGVKSNKSVYFQEAIPGNNKVYILDIINENGKDIVVVKDKNQNRLKQIPLLEWNKQKKYYESIYGEGVDELIEYAVKGSMSLETNTSQLKWNPENEIYMRPESFERNDVTAIDTTTIIADTIRWIAAKKQLLLTGRINLKNQQTSEAMSANADLICMNIDNFYVVLNGKELTTNNDYTSYSKSAYRLISLSKEKAYKKYGDKAKDGAIEIISQN